MFPKFIVVVTKHTPGIPGQSLDSDMVVETRYAESSSEAEQLAIQRPQACKQNAIANDAAVGQKFGESVTTWQAAIYEPQVTTATK